MGQKVVVTMDIQDESGQSVADIVGTFKNLDYANVVEIEKGVIGAFLAMGEARVAAKTGK